jgi:hypothetical protein
MERKVDKTAELPLTANQCVELVLTEAQIKRFSDIVHLQRLNPGSQTFMVLASSFSPEHGGGILRLQCKLVGKKSAMKALKILREAGNE